MVIAKKQMLWIEAARIVASVKYVNVAAIDVQPHPDAGGHPLYLSDFFRSVRSASDMHVAVRKVPFAGAWLLHIASPNPAPVVIYSTICE
jgi:hypothetical protein